MPKICIVEDDIYLREELESICQKKGYSTLSISSFACPIEDIVNASPDLVLLDLNLPGQSGFDICRSIRSKGISAVLVLTARNQLQDELHALDLGADDYLTKPCHPDRLIARIEKVLKLYGQMRSLLRAGSLVLDEKNYEVSYQEQSLYLAENEGKILRLLMLHAPNTVVKETLFYELWGSIEFVDENILQVNMTRLRKSLTVLGIGELIKTVRGVGYCLEVARDE